jgi:flagellar secretion chaperone FliS
MLQIIVHNPDERGAMVRGNLRQHYSEVHLTSSSPEETVLMLYDGAIRFLKEAAGKIAEEKITAKVQLLEKVEKIIEYLQSCLDKEQGGEIAENLHSLYDYMLLRLTEANLYNDARKLEEIGSLLGTLREGWASVCEASRKNPETNSLEPEKNSAATKNIAVSV